MRHNNKKINTGPHKYPAAIYIAMLFAAALCVALVVLPVESSAAKPYHFTIAAGETALLKNGKYRYDINPPILIFDTLYVELFDICELLDLRGQWLQSDGGEVVITGGGAGGSGDGESGVGEGIGESDSSGNADSDGDAIRFQHFTRYEDLLSPDTYFAVDGKIYIPAAEAAGFAGYGVTYEGGVMTMSPGGTEIEYEGDVFGVPDISGGERVLYDAYAEPSARVVDPYRAYSYENMAADARRLERMYPELIRVSGIGYSVEGRELLLIEFGKGDKKIFVCGAHHAREYISATYLMYAIDQYAYASAAGGMWENYDIAALLDSVKFCVVPMINPDGVNLVQNGPESSKDPDYIAGLYLPAGRYGYASWKSNVNGVDLNRNYDFGWTNERDSEYPRGYANFSGDASATEPETRAVSEYILSEDFVAFLSFHTQGQVYYFAGDTAGRLADVEQFVRRETGFTRAAGAADPGGTWFDFVRGHFGKTTMTVELCNYVGPYPYPDSSFDNVWRPARNILPIFAYVFSQY